MKQKKWLFSLVVLFFSLSLVHLEAYNVRYKEQWYRLYHIHFYQYPDDTIENIDYLEKALHADFCNPLYAMAKIENKKEWKRYRYLFNMHINLKLIELHLMLAKQFNKRKAYFYNYPWKEQNLKSLETAEDCFRYALVYWKAALGWSKKASALPWEHLEEIQIWEDESFRIQNKDLDYGEIIQRHLRELEKVRREFEKMGPGTY